MEVTRLLFATMAVVFPGVSPVSSSDDLYYCVYQSVADKLPENSCTIIVRLNFYVLVDFSRFQSAPFERHHALELDMMDIVARVVEQCGFSSNKRDFQLTILLSDGDMIMPIENLSYRRAISVPSLKDIILEFRNRTTHPVNRYNLADLLESASHNTIADRPKVQNVYLIVTSEDSPKFSDQRKIAKILSKWTSNRSKVIVLFPQSSQSYLSSNDWLFGEGSNKSIRLTEIHMLPALILENGAVSFDAKLFSLCMCSMLHDCQYIKSVSECHLIRTENDVAKERCVSKSTISILKPAQADGIGCPMDLEYYSDCKNLDKCRDKRDKSDWTEWIKCPSCKQTGYRARHRRNPGQGSSLCTIDCPHNKSLKCNVSCTSSPPSETLSKSTATTATSTKSMKYRTSVHKIPLFEAHSSFLQSYFFYIILAGAAGLLTLIVLCIVICCRNRQRRRAAESLTRSQIRAKKRGIVDNVPKDMKSPKPTTDKSAMQHYATLSPLKAEKSKKSLKESSVIKRLAKAKRATTDDQNTGKTSDASDVDRYLKFS